MLGENCPVITPTQKDSSMSFTERSATPSRNPSPRQLDHSAEILPCVESLQQPSTPTKDVVRGDHSGEVSDSDSDSESDSESCSDSDSHDESDSGSEHSLEKSPPQPSMETSSEIPADEINLGNTSPQEPDPNVHPKCTFTITKKSTIDKAQANRTKEISQEIEEFQSKRN